MIEARSYRETLQEAEYREYGAYHRKALGMFPTPSNIRYGLVKKLLPRDLDGQNCLDLGGGDGMMASSMADRGGKVVVFDPSSVALKYAERSDERLNVIRGQTKLPVKNGKFDLITMLETLEHIRDGEEMTALKEAFRALDDNGLFVISVPSNNRPVQLKHYRHYSLGDLLTKLEDAGFTVVKTIGYKGYLEGLRNLPKPVRRTIKGVKFGIGFVLGGFKVNMEFAKCKEKDAMGFIVLAKKTIPA